jgi:hypothetical protein
VPIAPAVRFPLAQGLVGLPPGWARGLGAVGGIDYLDMGCSIRFSTGPRTDPAGSVVLYIVLGQEPTQFTDAINPNTTADQAPRIKASTQLNFVQRIGGPGSPDPLVPSSRYSFTDFSIKSILGGHTPAYWAPLVLNLSRDFLSTIASPYAVYTVQT